MSFRPTHWQHVGATETRCGIQAKRSTATVGWVTCHRCLACYYGKAHPKRKRTETPAHQRT